MKIDNLYREDAIDLLADVLESATAIMQDEEFAKLAKSGATYMELALHALRKHKKETIDLVCVINGEDKETWNFTVWDVVNTFGEIMDNPNLSKVFGFQGQNVEQDSSGSVTETTQEEGL